MKSQPYLFTPRDKFLMETENRFLTFLHVPLLFLTSVTSIFLVCLINHKFTGSLLYRVQHHRTVTSVIVQISSTLLAAAQVYVFCTLINFAARLRSFQKFTRTSSLRILAALSASTIDWSLEWYAVVGTSLFCLIGPLVGAVWAGALTPLLDSLTRIDGTIQTPHYTGQLYSSFTLSSGGIINLNCSAPVTVLPLAQGASVSRCPAIGGDTRLLSIAQSTTTPGNATRIFPKMDVPAWSYVNRSYGAGSSQGLFPPTAQSKDLYTAYSYKEAGYSSRVTCAFNDTSNLTITRSNSVLDSPLAIWQVTGSLPNTVATDTSSYTLTTANSSWYDEVLGWSAARANGVNVLSVATWMGAVGAPYHVGKGPDHWYSKWNKLQCSVQFLPTTFNVAVNLTTSRISVTPIRSCPDFEPTNSLRTVVMANLDLISRMSSNIGTSTLGGALTNSANAVRANNPNMAYNDILIRGAENMITALVDDLLGAEASQQMAFDGDGVTVVKVQKVFAAARLGSTRFIYIALGINIALVLLVFTETIRTKAWHDLSTFNFTKLQGVMAAAMLSPSSHENACASDTDEVHDDVAAAARHLKESDIKWSHNKANEVVMLVRPPVDASREEPETRSHQNSRPYQLVSYRSPTSVRSAQV